MRYLCLLTGFILLFAAGCQPDRAEHHKKSQTTIKLKLLGQAVIPYNYSYKNTIVGGLSGLAYSPAAHQFYVVSDDRSQKSPARFYTFKIQLTKNGSFNENSIRFTDVHILKTPARQPYEPGTIDPEGIALGADGLIYISSEGAPRKGIAPFINGYTKDGQFVRSLPVPKAFWNPKNNSTAQQGIRTNLAFETLTATPNGQVLYTATENALFQDGPASDSTHRSPARIIAYDLLSGHILHQYLYIVDSIYVAPRPRGSFAVNGLTDMVALDNKGHFLAIERNFVAGQGNHITLYKVSIAGADDIQGVYSVKTLNRPVEPVQKKAVAHLNSFDINIGNFEGIALGPPLPGGGQLLLIVSDNNFSSSQQTIFTAFALHMQ